MQVNLERQSSDSSAEKRKWSFLSGAGYEAKLESVKPGIWFLEYYMMMSSTVSDRREQNLRRYLLNKS